MTLVASIKSKKGSRKGRGFSREEIKEAGLTIGIARELKVPLDPRRKSAYDSNITELKKLKIPAKKAKVISTVKPKEPTKKPVTKQVKKVAKKAAVKQTKKAITEPVKEPVKKVTKKPVKTQAKKPVKTKPAPKSKKKTTKK